MLLESEALEGRLDLPDRIRATKKFEQLIISKENKNLRSVNAFGEKRKPFFFKRIISKSDIGSQKPVYIKEININVTLLKTDRDSIDDKTGFINQEALFDWDLLKLPIIVRNYRKGDRFTPLGMTGSQAVKKFFINNKIRLLNRPKIPIFLSGNEIIWIGGFRIADSVKVTAATKTVLKATLSPLSVTD